MTDVFTFFETMPNSYKLIWILACLSVSWLLEFGTPLFHLQYNKLKHIGTNLVFLSTSVVINAVFGLATAGIFLWLSDANFGVLNWIDLNIWVELLLAILALDLFAQYVAHVLLHKVRWMWKFHLVHHSDTEVDATTGTRHHPGDYMIRELFALGAIILFGVPFAFYIIYRFCTIFFTYFSHANIKIPSWLDKTLSLVFISPNMHKFHHHFERPWTDTNFGNIFSLWDRAFGTFVYADTNDIVYGVDVLDPSTSTDIVYQFKLPFDKSIKTD